MQHVFLTLLAVAALAFGAIMAQDNLIRAGSACELDQLSDHLSDAETLYRCSLYLQRLAAEAGYVPDEQLLDEQVDLLLAFTDLASVIALTSVGGDVDAALLAIEPLETDSFAGQLLYNGVTFGLDGSSLGCAGCHNGITAPAIEGTWTRTDEIRLADPALEGYDVRRYLVESILHPNAYIADEYQPNLMPDNYGRRMNAQQLADLVAFLESQDQLIDEAQP
jgi:hypothetical protein